MSYDFCVFFLTVYDQCKILYSSQGLLGLRPKGESQEEHNGDHIHHMCVTM